MTFYVLRSQELERRIAEMEEAQNAFSGYEGDSGPSYDEDIPNTKDVEALIEAIAADQYQVSKLHSSTCPPGIIAYV